MNRIALIALIFLLTACGPSEAQIQRAIEETQTVISQTQTAQAKAIQDQVATQSAVQTATAVSAAAVATLEAFCGKERVASSISEMSDILSRYADDFDLAANTGRINLPPVVARMQDKKQEVERLSVPECLSDGRTHLAHSMEEAIDGFIAFMGEKPESTVSMHFDEGNRLIDLYKKEIDRIAACAPDCD